MLVVCYFSAWYDDHPADHVAAYGEINFEMFGFLCQAAAVAFEASRLVMIQLLLHGLKVRTGFTTGLHGSKRPQSDIAV